MWVSSCPSIARFPSIAVCASPGRRAPAMAVRMPMGIVRARTRCLSQTVAMRSEGSACAGADEEDGHRHAGENQGSSELRYANRDDDPDPYYKGSMQSLRTMRRIVNALVSNRRTGQILHERSPRIAHPRTTYKH